jgi:hypothetical protein
MARPANPRSTVDGAARPVLTLEPCRDVAALIAFYHDQFPGFSGCLVMRAIEHIAAEHSFLTLRNDRSLIAAIGAINYQTSPATELFLECSTLRGIGIHKVLAALETIWAFHTNDKLEFCFCVTERESIAFKNYATLGFSEVSPSDRSLPLEERQEIMGVPLQRNLIMMLRRSEIDLPIKWLRSRFHTGRFLVCPPGMPTFKLDDASLRISLFRIAAGMKSSAALEEVA